MELSKLEISTPDWNNVENNFLEDTYLTLEYDGKSIGEIVMTRYDWHKAIEFNTYRHWLCRENTYLGDLGNYLFDIASDFARLPLYFNEYSLNQDPVLILDHIKVCKRFQTPEIIDHIFETIVGTMMGSYLVMLTPRWEKIGKMLDLDENNGLEFFYKHGMHAIDQHMLLRYMDNPMESFSIDNTNID